MKRRAAIVGGILALALAVGAATWLWQSSQVPSADPQSSITTSPDPAPDMHALAQERLEELLTECAAQKTTGATGATVPERCGIRIPWGTEFSHADSIRFRVETMPVISLTDDGFVADGGVLVATITGVGLDGAPRTETYRNASWSVRGDVTGSGESMELSVW